MLRGTAFLVVLLTLVLSSCDTAGGDLVPLPTIQAEVPFVYPQDVTAQVEEVYTLLFSPSNTTLGWWSTNAIPLADLVDQHGAGSGAVAEITRVDVGEPIKVRSLSGADLREIDELHFGVGSHRFSSMGQLVARGYVFPSASEAELLRVEDQIAPSVYAGGEPYGWMALRDEDSGESYELAVDLPLAIGLRRPGTLSDRERLTLPYDLGPALRDAGAETGDVARAVVTAVRIDPEDMDVWGDYVEWVKVSVRAPGEDDLVQIAEVDRFGEPVAVTRDVAEALGLAGALEVVVDLVLSRTIPFVGEGALSFRVLLDVDVEVLR